MASKNSNVTFTMKLQGWRSLAEGADKSAKSIKGMGTAAETAGTKATRGFGRLSKSVEHAGKKAHQSEGHFGHLATRLAGLGIGFEAASGVKESVKTTTELTEQALKLNAVMGMNTSTAMQWAAVGHVHGIASKSMAQGFGTLSKNVVAAEQGGKKQNAAFQKLGITTQDLAGAGKDLNPLLLKLADRFKDMPGGADKAAVGMQLFGKGWQTILPLFREGNESLATNIKWAKQFGIAMGGETPEQMKKFLVAQDKAKYATLGLQIAIGTKLAPTLISLLNAWPRLVQNIRHGNGAWGSARHAVERIGGAIATVTRFFNENKWAVQGMTDAIGVLAAGYAFEKLFSFVKALRGAKTISAIMGGANKLLGRGGVAGALEARGSTPANPLFVTMVGGAGGNPITRAARTGSKLATAAEVAGAIAPFAAAAPFAAPVILAALNNNHNYAKHKGGIPGVTKRLHQQGRIAGPGVGTSPLTHHLQQTTGPKARFGGGLIGGLVKALGASAPSDVTVHVPINLEGRVIADVVSRHQLKAARHVP